MTQATSGARRTAAGALFIPVAKAWFIVVAFALNFLLPNLLHGDDVGDFGVVNRLVSLLNMVMITATIQTVSKFVSEDERRLASVQHAALRMQLVAAGGLSLAYFLLAPVIAASFNDPDLTPLLRASAPIPLLYGLYAVFIGSLNGTRAFRLQAGFDVGYATLRVGGIIGAVVLGFGVFGAFVAFSSAAFVVVLVAAVRIMRRPPDTTFPKRPLVGFALPLMGVVLFSNALLSTDLFWVKAVTDPETSKAVSGCYFALLNLAVVPYMLLVSVSFILFPLISRATFEQRREQTKLYIERSLRATLLLAFAGETAIAVAPEVVIGLVYPSKPEYLVEAPALRVLAMAYAILCVASVMMSIVNSAGRPRRSLAVGLVAVIVQSCTVAPLVGRFGLIGAAVGSLVAFVCATVLLGMHLKRTHDAGVAVPTVLRALLASGVALAIVAWLTRGGEPNIVHVLAGAAIYVIVLVATREVGPADLRRIQEMR